MVPSPGTAQFASDEMSNHEAPTILQQREAKAIKQAIITMFAAMQVAPKLINVAPFGAALSIELPGHIHIDNVGIEVRFIRAREAGGCRAYFPSGT